MALVNIDFRYTFQDHEQETSTIVLHEALDESTTAAGLETKAQALLVLVAALSGLLVKEYSFSVRTINTLARPGTPGAYGTIEDKIWLDFQSNATGNGYSLQIPGPKAGLTMSDSETVDPAQADVAALISEIEANAQTKGRNGALAYMLGYRRRAKSRREKAGVATAIG